ncbi:MAG: leucine--tRNA ligase, partial [candidate division Zixibacteria bacterium]|nr:leucine--tRNA ligase [candidate division Zixibacteria bacterium]
REVITCLPDYYKWTQWMFVQLYKHNLAYRGKSLVNWCPHCNTVLANEQVIQGTCWKCHSEVTKKELVQWFFRITGYAERLLKDMDKLSGWPENVKIMQRNWIGKSQGVEINFKVEKTGEKLPVFTTRPDTIYGVTFMAIAPENELLKRLQIEPKYKKAVDEYVNKALQKTDIERSSIVGEKDGVFTGRYAINPLSGEKVQLWVAEYVVATYGTGVVMGVPGHDQRDFEFAKKYNIPIKVVIQPKGENLTPETMEQAYEDPGTMVNSDIFNKLWSTEGIEKINDYIEEKGLGKRKTNYKLRDWLISRQRYWGAPIPMIHCKKCGIVPVPESDLPVLLPKGNIDYLPKGRSPLADVKEFIETTCPNCGGKAERDPDTMDTFVCSSWYLFRYTDPHNDKEPFSREKAKKWMPVDKYIGGIEHATGHLLYFRFFTKVLHDIGWLSVDEPAIELFNHGMVLDSKGEVMSKSKGNATSPLDLMEENGVDVSRIAVYFAAPSGKEVLWTGEGIAGARRFLTRIYDFAKYCIDTYEIEINNHSKTIKLLGWHTKPYKTVYRKLHQTIKKVTEDIERLDLNTAIASMMELLNTLDDELYLIPDTDRYEFLPYFMERTTQLLAPFAPHLTEEIWEEMGHKDSIFKSEWPEYDQEAVIEDEVTIAVQINGKLRTTFNVPINSEQKQVESIALSDKRVQAYTKDKEIVKTIYVPNKILNIVVK